MSPKYKIRQSPWRTEYIGALGCTYPMIPGTDEAQAAMDKLAIALEKMS